MKQLKTETYFIYLIVILAISSDIVAQKNITIQIYHGMNKQTQFLQRIDNSQPIDMAGNNYIDAYYPKGTKIVLEVVNAHMVNYKYGFTSTSTPFSPTSSDITDFSEQLSSLLQTQENFGLVDKTIDCDAFKKTIDAIRDSIVSYNKLLNRAKQEAAESVAPKEYSNIKRGEESRFIKAVRKIKKILNRKINLEVEYKKLEENLIPVFKEYANFINTVRDKYLELYNFKNAVYRDTVVVGEGITNISLSITAQNKDTGNIRDTGNNIINIRINQTYERPTLSLIPLAYAVYIKDYDEFEISDDVLAKKTSITKFDFRIGTMLAISPFELSESNEYGLSFGLGLNLIGGDLAALKEFFLGSFFSYKDDFRIGLGWGMARSPALKSGAVLGEPLPEGKNLDELVEHRRDNSSFFILFSIKGLDLSIF